MKNKWIAIGIIVSLLFSSGIIWAAPTPKEDVTFYHCDALGTPVAMTNMQGNVVWRGNCLPFGEDFSGSGTRNTEIRYTGKPYNPALGLYDFGARYYDPNVGRFTSTDPIMGELENPQRLNSYAYGLNSPYKYVDPDGQYAIEIGAFIVGALLFGGYVATHHGQAPDISFANPFKKTIPYEEYQAQTSGVAGGAPNPWGEQPGGDKDKKVVNKKQEAPGAKGIQQMIKNDDPIIGSLENGKVNIVDSVSKSGGHRYLGMGKGENGFTITYKNQTKEFIIRGSGMQGNQLSSTEIQAIKAYFGLQ